MQAIQKNIYKNADMCFPCACILRDEGWNVPTTQLGVPDVENGSCTEPLGACEGTYRKWAEGCLELGRPEPQDENFQAWVDQECDPRYVYGMLIYDDNETCNQVFPEICAGRW